MTITFHTDHHVSLTTNITPPIGDPVYDRFSLRVPHPNVDNFNNYVDLLGGRMPFAFRHVIDHTDGSGEPMFSDATGSAWGYWVATSGSFNLGYLYPEMTTSTIFPAITEPPGNLSAAARQARMVEVINGYWDHKFATILGYVNDAPAPQQQQRFCLNSESELDDWAYSKVGIDPVVWVECFDYVAAKIHAAGHLVVYAGDGPFLQNLAPGGDQWWEYAMPSLESFDIFGCDLYISSTVDPEDRLPQFTEIADIAASLGKDVAFPEYGVREGVYSDAEANAFLDEAWDRMADMPHLDHHCIWNDNDAKQTAGMKAHIAARFGA